MKHIKPPTGPVRPHRAPAGATEHRRPTHRRAENNMPLNDALARFGEDELGSAVVYEALRRIARALPERRRDDAIQRAALRLMLAAPLPRLKTPDQAWGFLRTTLQRAFYDLRAKGSREFSTPEPARRDEPLAMRGPDEVVASKERWEMFMRLVECTAGELRCDAGEKHRRLIHTLIGARFGLATPSTEGSTASGAQQRWCRARKRLRETLRAWVEADQLTLDESRGLDAMIDLVRSA